MWLNELEVNTVNSCLELHKEKELGRQCVKGDGD